MAILYITLSGVKKMPKYEYNKAPHKEEKILGEIVITEREAAKMMGEDVKTGDPKIIIEQIEKGKNDLKQADHLESDMFFRRFK